MQIQKMNCTFVSTFLMEKNADLYQIEIANLKNECIF